MIEETAAEKKTRVETYRRYPVAMTSHDDVLHVLCLDRTIWRLGYHFDAATKITVLKWTQIPDVPNGIWPSQ